MLILIMMVVSVVGPLVALIVTEVCDAKWDRKYNEVMEQRYAERRVRKWEQRYNAHSDTLAS